MEMPSISAMIVAATAVVILAALQWWLTDQARKYASSLHSPAFRSNSRQYYKGHNLIPFDKMETAARTRLQQLARQKVNGDPLRAQSFDGRSGGRGSSSGETTARQPNRNGDPRPEGTPSSRSRKRG